MATYVCQKCGRSIDEKNFYTNHDGSKTDLCKKCLTMHIDNLNENTFVWILEKMDIPYIPGEWNVLRDKAYAKNPSKVNGMTVFGKYLSKMKLKQYHDKTWADSEALQEEFLRIKGLKAETTKDYENEMKNQLEEGIISEAQYKTLVSTTAQYEDVEYKADETAIAADGFYNENKFMREDELPDPGAELTQEDKLMLAVKWGRLYTPSQWVELEKKYQDMMKSFDIQDSDTEGTLLVICKTYLKMNEALDIGDLDGFQKLSKVYDSLRKSAKFQAVQNKEQNNSFLDSVGELVAYCEKHGGAIPKFQIEEPLDKVDKIIADLKEYNKTLIYADTTLSTQIEDYLKQRRALDEKKLERELNGGKEVPLTDKDYEQHLNTLLEDYEHDKEVYKQ